MRISIIITMSILCSIAIANAEMYKWVDENGVSHFSNTAPPSQEDVQTTSEVKGADPSPARGKGLSDVLRQYKDDLQDDRRYSTRKDRPQRNDRVADMYSMTIERRQRDVKQWEDRLSQAKRESYSNKQDHENNIRHCEKMLHDYQSLLKEAQDGYNRAKFGQ